MPIPARQEFILLCTYETALPISDAIRPTSAGKPSPSGFLAIKVSYNFCGEGLSKILPPVI